MSTFVLHNTAVIAGCRAASSTRTRVVSVVRAPSAVRIGTTPGALNATMAANRDRSRSTIVRASEDEAPAAESTVPPTAREPEEDSEEVKGAKLTAIVTGAGRRPTQRRQLFLLSRRAELSTRRRRAKDADPSRPFNPDPQAS